MRRRRTSSWGRLLDLLPLFLLVCTPARGEEKHPDILNGENRALSIRLDATRKLLDEQKWSQAVEGLQSILNGNGNDLVPLTPSHSIRAGRLCQIQLAALPAEALRLYRQRYENPARKKLEQAQAERDVTQLRKLVEDDFCTRAAEKAIDLLGDLAFERGRFEEAEEWWRLLAPPPEEKRDVHPARPQPTPGEATLVYPDPSIDPARSQAKQLLARLFQDSTANAGDSAQGDGEWKAALGAFRQKHDKAEGTLAGRKGRYVDLLVAVAEERKQQGDVERSDWPTFGGDFSRGRTIPASEDILDRLSDLCSRGPTWSFSLEQRTRRTDLEPSPAVNAAQARLLDFYPVLVGNQLLMADARFVTSFDLRNGQSQEWYDVAVQNGGMKQDKLAVPPDLRYTLTVAEGHVYARLGAQDIGLESPPPRFGQAKQHRETETYLSCLSLRPDDRGNHFRWSIRGITHENSLFEGTPVAAGGLIWIASTFARNNRLVSAIDCYSSDDSSQPPLRWRCELCETSETKVGEPRYRHQLLTLAGTQLVYCAHNGAVVAIDALTGRRNWAIRYPRRALETEEVELRDLAPVLFAAGRLYVAPADSDSLLCLDPATGRTLWELQPLRVIHLLGIGQGRLIFTTPHGLRAVQADNGNPVWSVPDTGRLMPAGRGLLIGDLVLFPTTQQRDQAPPSMATMVYALRQSDGRPADDPARLHRLPAGNLAYANGCLAVADRQTLSVFVPPRLLLDVRKAEVQRQPDSARGLLELARAEADAGLHADALKTLARSDSLLQALPDARRQNLLDRLNSQRQVLLLEMGRRAAHTERWEEAASALQQAIDCPLPPRRRLHALLTAAQIWAKANQTERAAAVWHIIAADDTLRAIPVIDSNGKPTSAAQSAASSLADRGHSVRVTAASVNTGGADAAALAEVQKPPLFRSWHTRLESNEWILTAEQQSDPKLLLTGSPDGRMRCRLTSTGETSWTRRLPFAPRWSGSYANTILAAGEAGVACLRRDNGKLLWHFPAPDTGRCAQSAVNQVRVVLDPQPPEPLTAFQLASGRLFFLQGQRRLFALNAETGLVIWDCWAPDGPLHLPFPHGCFSPCYRAGTETLLIQMAGRRWLLDARTGRPIHRAEGGRDLWQRTPLELDDHSLCVVLDNRSVGLLDTRTGQSRWTHQLTGTTTRSGEMPSVLGKDNLLLCVQPTNFGYLLHRLDCQSGNPVWVQPRLLKAKSVDVSAWTFDAETLYSIEEDGLIARSLADGERRWRRELPVEGTASSTDTAWQACRVGDSLLVSPQAFGAETRFRFRSPLGTVQWEVGSLLAPEAIYPLSCFDRKTGRLIQRLHFRIESPVRTTLEKRLLAEGGRGLRIVRTSSLLASERGPVMRLDSPHPFAAIGVEVWGLTASLEDLARLTDTER